MKNILTYFLLLIPFLVAGQTGQVDYFNSDTAINQKVYQSNFNEEEIETYLKEKKMKFGLSAGAFAGTSFGSGEYFGTFVSPQVSYPLTSRFTVSVGMTLTNTFGNPYYYPSSEGGYGYPSANFTRSFLYASGAYQLSERLVVSGTVYKEFNMFDQQSSLSKNYSGDYQGVIMGVDYKIGKNVFIQGQIEISNNPYHRQSYPNSYFGNGFGNSSFGRYPPF